MRKRSVGERQRKPGPFQGGLSLSELARQVGVTQGFMSLVYRGLRTPHLDTAAKISKKTGLSIDCLCRFWQRQRKENVKQAPVAA